MYLDARIRNSFYMAIQFSIKRSLSCYNPGGTEEILMHEAGAGKMVFGDFFALCSISASSALWFIALSHKSLSATKATFLSCGSNCICQVVRTDIIQQHCSDGQDSWLAERISHISRTQEKNPNPLEMYRSSSDTYLKLHSVCDPPGGSKSLQKVTKESKLIARRLTFILQRQILLLKFSGSQKRKENIEKHQFK